MVLKDIKDIYNCENTDWPVDLNEWRKIRDIVLISKFNENKIRGAVIEIYVSSIEETLDYPSIDDIVFEIDSINEDKLYSMGFTDRGTGLLISDYHKTSGDLEYIVSVILEFLGLIYKGHTTEDLSNANKEPAGTVIMFREVGQKGVEQYVRRLQYSRRPNDEYLV